MRQNGFSSSSSNCGKIKPEADGHQRDRASPPDRVLRKMQQRQQCRPEESDQAEAEHQPADHPVRPQPLGKRRLGLHGDRGPPPATRRPAPSGCSVRRRRRSPAAPAECTARCRLSRPPRKPISTSVNMSVIRSHNTFGWAEPTTQNRTNPEGPVLISRLFVASWQAASAPCRSCRPVRWRSRRRRTPVRRHSP